MLKEFKEFIARGNVIDLAVGIIIGAAFTAIVNSLTKVDHSLATNGTLMNLRFPQEAVAGIEGRDNLASFIEEYIHKGAMHVQFNIMSAATMRAAQKKPEDYKDMLVRVAGYSAYFVDLSPDLQNDLIARTEHDVM